MIRPTQYKEDLTPHTTTTDDAFVQLLAMDTFTLETNSTYVFFETFAMNQDDTSRRARSQFTIFDTVDQIAGQGCGNMASTVTTEYRSYFGMTVLPSTLPVGAVQGIQYYRDDAA